MLKLIHKPNYAYFLVKSVEKILPGDYYVMYENGEQPNIIGVFSSSDPQKGDFEKVIGIYPLSSTLITPKAIPILSPPTVDVWWNGLTRENKIAIAGVTTMLVGSIENISKNFIEELYLSFGYIISKEQKPTPTSTRVDAIQLKELQENLKWDEMERELEGRIVLGNKSAKLVAKEFVNNLKGKLEDVLISAFCIFKSFKPQYKTEYVAQTIFLEDWEPTKIQRLFERPHPIYQGYKELMGQWEY